MRAPSPADLRCNLAPATVDALADQLHTLNCVPLNCSACATQHRDYDLSRARFLLLGLRDAGWRLTREAP